MRKPIKKWYITFRPKQRWSRFGDRFYIIEATSFDQAMKQSIKLFGRDWLNVVSEDENPDVSGLTQVEYNEVKKEIERQNRIPFKTYREKETDGRSSTKGN